MDPINNSLIYLDSKLLNTADNLKKIWNYTTGKSRAELSDLGLKLGAASIVLGYFPKPDLFNLFNASLGIYLGYTGTKINKYQEEKDYKSSITKKEDSSFLGLRTFSSRVFTGMGLADIALSGVFYKTDSLNDSLSFFAIGTGLFIMGISNYVMRTDYINCHKNTQLRRKSSDENIFPGNKDLDKTSKELSLEQIADSEETKD